MFGAATMAEKTYGERGLFIPHSPLPPPYLHLEKIGEDQQWGHTSQVDTALTLQALRDTAVWPQQPQS